MTILEPAVTITDYLLALECAIFVWLLKRDRAGPLPGHRVRQAFVQFFLAVGLASFFGGTVHGFFPDPESFGHEMLWMLTLVAIGGAALSAGRLGVRLLDLGSPRAWRIERSLEALFIGYVVVVAGLSRDFLVAIAFYLPAAVFLLAVYLKLWRAKRERAVLFGIWGLGLIFAGAAIQQGELALHPVYFDHDAVYHVVQGVALYLLFRSSLSIGEPS